MQEPMTEKDVSLAVLASKLDDIREDIRDLKAGTITRGEWAERNSYVDARFTNVNEQVTRIKQQIAESTAPWWTYATIFVAAGALLWTVFGPIG